MSPSHFAFVRFTRRLLLSGGRVDSTGCPMWSPEPLIEDWEALEVAHPACSETDLDVFESMWDELATLALQGATAPAEPPEPTAPRADA